MGMRPVYAMLLVGGAIALISSVGPAEPYSGVGAVLDLGAGARPLGMGGRSWVWRMTATH